ncbi:4Fe-4S dicluster domain-containing protein [Glaciimonas immobilis]|uniref:Ferredoxin n=1 Tax=Glaciimonas immobilis TaxID=728004 RepID=A0A840RYR1_9BURK|nr:ferredoxin family protein [Glaciimonas immobilis]KAF3995934.1 ferredoxin family protein [Glaciimonas immobilis]MBB5202683.1 ferredoxin [Glaciimonas immobilis]
MAFIVGKECNGCKYTVCVDVCPVDAFHEAEKFLVINPDTCISCSVCAPECPVDAIYDEFDLPIKQISYLEINRNFSSLYPVISASKATMVFRK